MAAQALEFVKKCTLATKLPLGVSTSATHADYDPEQGFVCGGSTVSFTENLEGQQKIDVLNSTLFAQLVANDRYSREVPEWYKEYVHVLGSIGYEMEGTLEFEEYDGESPTFTMGAVVLDVLKGLATDEEMRLEQATFHAMKTVQNQSNSHAVQLFDDCSKTSITNGGFQIFPCTIDSNNNVLLTFVACYFKSAQDGNNILFFDYITSSTSLFTAGKKCRLRMHVYDAVRDKIVELLGETAKTAVAEICLD